MGSVMTFGLFNVIVAIYVENTVAAAKYNDVAKKRRRIGDAKMVALKAQELVAAIMRVKEGREPESEHMVGKKSSRKSLRTLRSPSFGELVDKAAFLEITPEF